MFAHTTSVNRANSLLPAIARSVVVAGACAFIPAAWPAVVGEVAPSCAAPAIDDGRTIHVADYKGKVVYLDFWASWCAPCRESFPFMNELQRELGDKGLQIIAVSVDKVPDDARHFLARYPAQFTVVLDSTWTCPSAYLLQGMPTSYVIDRTGVIRAVHIGFREGDKAGIRRQLLEILNEGK